MAAVFALGILSAGCANNDRPVIRGALVATTTSEPTTTLPPTTVAAPATTAIKTPLPGFGRGSSGPEVQALEQRLADLHYDVGKVDGSFDSTTQFAVTAFQKIEGMERSGRATPDVVAKLQAASAPAAMVPGGGSNHVEVDIKRQILLLFKNGELYRVLPVSTGSGKRYCVDGDCATAVTPGGSFKVTWRWNGWRTSRLGKLYNPLYFNGGIAIHGALSVPNYPASHGCVRIPMSAAGWFPGQVASGTPVYVLNGITAPVPFDEPAPNGAPPSSVPTTSTVPPTTTTTQGGIFPGPGATTTTAPPA
jgi:peptidoglycan hydrolase-like protein with peptidoglycan-binding domain